MREFLTPKQVARALDVSEASLKRWCDKGLLPVVRTAGGHRRLPLSGVIQFVRERGGRLVRPEVLGLPPTTGLGRLALERAMDHMRAALEISDEAAFVRAAFNLYLAGYSAAEVCDRAIAPVFAAIGHAWEAGELEVYRERRAVEIATRLLHRLIASIATPATGAPLALGGALSGDQYSLPPLMCELALRESGWQAEALGVDLPQETLLAAVAERRPALFWTNVSFVAQEPQFLESFAQISAAAGTHSVPLAAGGRMFSPALQSRFPEVRYCARLSDLITLAQALRPTPTAARVAS